MRREFDFIVVGSGIAGLFFAHKVSSLGTVAIVTKKNRAESNTNYAQGGIAAVTSEEDSFDMHVRDTLNAGAGLCDEAVVRSIVEEGPGRIRDLIELGMEFSVREDLEHSDPREYDLGKEGGHSKRRILHKKDTTGRAIEKALLNAISRSPNVEIYENHVAVDLITRRNEGEGRPRRCHGLYAYDRKQGQVETFLGGVTLLATGGCGKVYLYTSNPDIATGDGVAMAYRAGARLANMEFVQFHPTCLYHPKAKSFLVSEAVRGEGGVLIGKNGREFMGRYHEQKSLAPRDVVARAIDAEMKKRGSECVFLDITHKSARFIMSRFPNIYKNCLKFGIDMTKEPIPVVPAAHYQCGGVVVNMDSQTDIEGLYAVGEVACTGLHGANRLASNSLLEAVVCANRAVGCIQRNPLPDARVDVEDWKMGATSDADELVVVSHNWDEIRRTMWDYVGIVRTMKRLKRARTRIENLKEEIRDYYSNFRVTGDLIELRNLATVASTIVESALVRPESRGLHYNLDYPNPNPDWEGRNTVISQDR